MGLAYIVYLFSLYVLLMGAFSFRRFELSGKGKRSSMSALTVMSIAIVSLMMSLRYDVGTDWQNYNEIFDTFKLGSPSLSDALAHSSSLEPLYSLLNYGVASVGGSYQFLQFVIMCLHLLLIFQSCRTIPKYTPLVIFFYFSTLFFSSLNIHRQTLAICIFLFALHYLIENKTRKYYLFSAIACLFHYSSVVILLVPFLKSKVFRLLDNKYVCLVLYVAGFFLGYLLVDMIVTYLPMITDNAKYNSTLEELEHIHEYSSGLGLLFYKLLDIVIILNIPNFVKSGYGLYSRAFVIGAMLSNAFANSMFLSRAPLPLTSIKIYLLSFIIYSYWRSKEGSLRKCFAVFVLIFTFLGLLLNISNGNSGCSPFQFY